MLVPVGTEPVPGKVVLGAEGVAPAVGEPRPAVLGVPGTALPAVLTASIPAVTEPGGVGLVPAGPVPRKQVTGHSSLGWRWEH